MKYTRELYSEKCSALPKTWRIKHEMVEGKTTQRFKDTVLKYLNDNYSDWFSGNSSFSAYYGVIHNQSQCSSRDSSWRGATLLTVDEFISIVEKGGSYEIY